MAFPAAAPFLLAGGITALSKKLGNGALVAAIVTGITYMFKTKLGLFVMGAMLWLGINFASMTLVIGPAIDILREYANPGTISGGGAGELALTAVAWLGVLNFDRAITMVLSAIYTRHAVNSARLYLTRAPVGGTP
ncbi:DUF2523 family protein [Luteimonas sp BLCC-B24]|uniref:DUF2523 family protein n=1 Tax=Luteimonas sp. BLCC-B24 TaxID=3025317 RepID=UPI00234CA2C1|nr:DUF2523 family protein [Luteimonas sp. BLCC-B24]MDC7805226.1 DUF2523 family protein [Luteimonas sp. BLCC-B24]